MMFINSETKMKVKNIIIDLDGVLTDGKQYIDASGEKIMKAVHARDKLALRRLIASGYNVVVLTSDDWPGARFWFVNIGCEFAVAKEKHLQNINWQESIGIGDDFADLQWLEMCAMAFCPFDADPRLLDNAYIETLDSPGGGGVVCEVEAFLESCKIESDAILG